MRRSIPIILATLLLGGVSCAPADGGDGTSPGGVFHSIESSGLTIEQSGATHAVLKWRTDWVDNAPGEYIVSLDGRDVRHVHGGQTTLVGLRPGKTYEATVTFHATNNDFWEPMDSVTIQTQPLRRSK